MHLLIVILITYCSAGMLESTQLSRQSKEFTSKFNNYLQLDFKSSDFVPFAEEINRVNIVYKTVEEPVRIEKIIPVPMVKYIPQPVPVYVPRPFPVEKKVFVPYKIYEKQHIPIIHRYPVVKEIPVALQIVPFHMPIDVPREVVQSSTETKEVSLTTNNSSKFLSAQSMEVPFIIEKSSNVPELNTVKIDYKSNLSKQTYHSIFKKNLGLVNPGEKFLPFGTRISVPVSRNDIKYENKCFTSKCPENSREIKVITGAPEDIDRNERHTTSERLSKGMKDEVIDKSLQTEDNEVEVKSNDVKEGNATMILSTERNDVHENS